MHDAAAFAEVPEESRLAARGIEVGHIFQLGDKYARAMELTVLDADGELPVDYEGILPDLFRENQAVIATGSMAGGRFVATEVLAKHDESYMPKEVADKMGINHARSGVDAGTGTGRD